SLPAVAQLALRSRRLDRAGRHHVRDHRVLHAFRSQSRRCAPRRPGVVMRVYAAFIYVFLYSPIALIVFFSFNAGRYAMDWQGFSVEWYGRAFTNPIVTKALVSSLIIASSTAVIATVVGTLCALGLERMRGWLRQLFDALIYIAIMVPGVVIGIS